MAKHLWIDKEYMKTYHPSTHTPVNPVHAQAAQAAAVGAVTGAMAGAQVCGVNPPCIGSGALTGALIGAQGVYTHNFFNAFKGNK